MSSSTRIDFFTNQGAAATSADKAWRGGPMFFTAEASNWNGASLALKYRGPGGTLIDAGVTLTANGTVLVDVADGSALAATITGTPTGLYCTGVSEGSYGQ